MPRTNSNDGAHCAQACPQSLCVLFSYEYISTIYLVFYIFCIFKQNMFSMYIVEKQASNLSANTQASLKKTTAFNQRIECRPDSTALNNNVLAPTLYMSNNNQMRCSDAKRKAERKKKTIHFNFVYVCSIVCCVGAKQPVVTTRRTKSSTTVPKMLPRTGRKTPSLLLSFSLSFFLHVATIML